MNTPRRFWVLLLLTIYLLSGFYVIRGNQQGVIRQFGRVNETLAGPGLHYSWPWPGSRIDRVNRQEIRTLSVGLGLSDESTLISFDAEPASYRRGEFLTGDKNVLLMSALVQYRVADPIRYLFGSEETDRHLRNLVETEVTSVVSRCGVDYVHPLGLNEIRSQLSVQVQLRANQRGLGVEIEDVVLSDVRPPPLVKQAFLDVSNARAERSRLVSEAQANGDRLIVQAQAKSQQIRDEASVERQARIAIAYGERDRFLRMQEKIPTLIQADGDSRQKQNREDLIQLLVLQTLSEIVPTLKGKVFTEGERPVDLTVWDDSTPLKQQP